MTSSSSNIIVEELTPEVFLPTISTIKNDKLLRNQDINEDNSENTRVYTKEIDDIKQKTILRSMSSTSNNSKLCCNFFKIMLVMILWFE
jgi:hypothetical protein